MSILKPQYAHPVQQQLLEHRSHESMNTATFQQTVTGLHVSFAVPAFLGC